MGGMAYLDEANVGGLLTEALTADVEAVLADQTCSVGADAAVKLKTRVSTCYSRFCADSFFNNPSVVRC